MPFQPNHVLSLLLWFFCMGLLLAEPPEGLIDLETHLEPSLLHTKQIQIPDHPYGFNPSLVAWKDGWLLSFREIERHEKFLVSHLYMVKLAQNFEPISAAQRIHTDSVSPADARLLNYADKIYCVFSNKEPPKKGDPSIWRISIAEVKEKNNTFFLHNQARLTDFPSMCPHRDEKNWVPFFYDHHLLLAYTLHPHCIFHAQLGLNSCTAFSSNITKTMWKFGQMRGGTPAIHLKGCYLSFFHSSKWLHSIHSQGIKSSHYFMGAYTFSDTPPFAIQSVSTRPIVGQGFYSGLHYEPYWNKSVQAIFPGGLVEHGPYLLVAYGRQDHEMWIATFDTKLLLNSLRPLHP